MRHLVLLLTLLLFFVLLGCDGDGDGDGGAVVPSGTDTTDGEAPETPTEQLLLDTGGTVGFGEHFIGSAIAPGSGTLRATIAWEAPPTQLTLYLKQQDGSGESGQVTGASPLTVTYHVDGGQWSPYIQNGFPMSVYVAVEIYFLSD